MRVSVDAIVVDERKVVVVVEDGVRDEVGGRIEAEGTRWRCHKFEIVRAEEIT